MSKLFLIFFRASSRRDTFSKSGDFLREYRKVFLTDLRTLDRKRDARLSAPELKAVLAAHYC